MVRLLAAGISFAVGLLAVAVLFMLLGLPRTDAGWLWTLALGLMAIGIAWVCLSLGLRTSSALEQGRRQAADERRGDRFESTGRTAGRAVGTGVAKASKLMGRMKRG